MFGRQNLFERISGVILTASDAADMSARQTCGTLPAVDNATPMPVETVCDPPGVEGRYLRAAKMTNSFDFDEIVIYVTGSGMQTANLQNGHCTVDLPISRKYPSTVLWGQD